VRAWSGGAGGDQRQEKKRHCGHASGRRLSSHVSPKESNSSVRRILFDRQATALRCMYIVVGRYRGATWSGLTRLKLRPEWLLSKQVNESGEMKTNE